MAQQFRINRVNAYKQYYAMQVFTQLDSLLSDMHPFRQTRSGFEIVFLLTNQHGWYSHNVIQSDFYYF